MKQHKWHKEIKAWADGAKIEGKWKGEKEWWDDDDPEWGNNDFIFRLKVEPQYLYVYEGQDGNTDVSLDSNCPFEYWTLKGKIKLENNDD